MRKITSAFFISLDGVVEAPHDWHFPYFNDEMGAAIDAAVSEADALLMGRVLYSEWADYWPAQDGDDPFTAFINNVQKFVVSNTLDGVEWNNSTLVQGDVMAEIARLKEQPGKTIAMSGSGTLARSLLEADLLDELHLMVHPIVVGRGKRLFPEGSEQKGLKLVQSKTFSTGVVYLIYERASQDA